MAQRYTKGRRIYENQRTGVKVFEAQDTQGLEVIVKEIETRRFETVSRMLKESWMQACMSHPNVCRLLGSYYHMEGGLYTCGIVMEKMPMDLRRVISEAVRWKGASGQVLPESTIWRYLQQLISALAYAQERSISHRDIKPENLFVDPPHFLIKVGDMGASKPLSTEELDSTVQGTVNYLSPLLRKQHIQNTRMGTHQKATHIPFKSDVFSLGITCLEMALGNVPIQVHDLDQQQEALNEAIALLSSYTSSLRAFIRTMLEVEEATRPDFLTLRKILIERFAEALVGAGMQGCIWCFSHSSTEDITLPCGHMLCGKECLLSYIAHVTTGHKLPLNLVICRFCNVHLPQELLLRLYPNGYPPESESLERCLYCRHMIQALGISRCTHHFCLNCLKTLKMTKRKAAKACPECNVPFDRRQLKKHKAMCVLF